VSQDIPPTASVPQVEPKVWVAALVVTVAGVVLAKWFVDTALPLSSAYQVTGVTDTAAAAFGHRLLMIIAQAAVQMISWGIALLLAIFVPIAVAAALSSVKFREKPPEIHTTTTTTRSLTNGTEQTETVTIGGIDVAGFFKAVSDMLKLPAGFGGLLLALGTLLLVLGLSSQAAGAGPSPSPSVSPGPSASGSPAPSGSPVESEVPSEPTTPSSNPSTAPTATGG
jgi:hypothetical protein